MIDRLVLIGATGDLARRFLLPAIAALQAAGKLDDSFRLIGSARDELDDEAFRAFAGEQLRRHAGDLSTVDREAALARLTYRRAQVDSAPSMASLLDQADGGGVAIYLALPPNLFPVIVRTLAGVGLPPHSRIVLEKPFGDDLDSAVTLNRLLADAVGLYGERAVFRIDHVLGMATVQNLLAMRLANPFLDAVWNAEHLERVEVLWEETLALEGRAGYYDGVGALKDVVQNHMLQILAVLAMELPVERDPLDEGDLRARKLEALRSISSLGAAAVASRTRRARYTAGRLADGSGRSVPGYVDEDGVDATRGTETFAEVVLTLDSERWAGTPFVLRAGKALGRRRKMAILHFRGPGRGADGRAPIGLAIGVDGPDGIELRLTGGTPSAVEPVVLSAPPPAAALPPYANVLLDVLANGSALSVGGDEAEEEWRVIMPVLNAWRDGAVPMEEYAAGSDGPRRRIDSGEARTVR